ncbi:MAG: hypothetical protein WDN72_03475 [Alphaproteobacteria bacterium]
MAKRKKNENLAEQLQVKPGAKVALDRIDPDFTGGYEKKSAQKISERNSERLRALQELMYAEHKRSLIICLQALDAGARTAPSATC